MYLLARLAVTALLTLSTAFAAGGGHVAEVTYEQPSKLASDEEDDMCLLQSRHSLGLRGAGVAYEFDSTTADDATSLLQSSGGEVVSRQSAGTDAANEEGSEATGSKAVTSAVASGDPMSNDGFGNGIASSEAAGFEVERKEVVSMGVTSKGAANIKAAKSKRASSDEVNSDVASSAVAEAADGEVASIEVASSEEESLGEDVTTHDAPTSDIVSGEVVSSEVADAEATTIKASTREGERLGIEAARREVARSEASSMDVAGGEASIIEAARKEGERLGIEVAERNLASRTAVGRGAVAEADLEYRRVQHAAGSLAELARSSALGYQAASAAVGEKAIGFLVVVIGLSLGAMLHEQLQTPEDRGLEKCDPEPLDEDAYGLAIESMIHNMALIAAGSGTKCHWLSRLALVQGLVFLNMALQMYLLNVVLRLCASVSVHDIREDYDKYELHMYGGLESHTWLTENGKHRGVAGYFEARNFATLPEDLKKSICNIPFSQPLFFIVVIFIWTLVCVREVKIVHDTYRSLIVNTERCDSMAQGHTSKAADRHIVRRSASHVLDSSRGREEVILTHITRPIKAYIVFFILLPRLIITCCLCYIGCRWLAATNNFTDLVLNAVALEFVMGLKDLLYVSLVPNRNKRDLRNTLAQPPYMHEPANFSHFLGTFIWFFVALLWCCVYTFHVQRVLPQYNWDVRSTCEQWLAEATMT